MSTVAESPLTINPSMPLADARAVCKKAVEAGYCSQESADEALETYFAARAQNVGIKASRCDNGNGYTKADPRPYRQNAKGGLSLQIRRPSKGEHVISWVSLDPEGWALLAKFVADGVVANMLKDYNAGTCPKSHNAC
jgi:hypothetical protein